MFLFKGCEDIADKDQDKKKTAENNEGVFVIFGNEYREITQQGNGHTGAKAGKSLAGIVLFFSRFSELQPYEGSESQGYK